MTFSEKLSVANLVVDICILFVILPWFLMDRFQKYFRNDKEN